MTDDTLAPAEFAADLAALRPGDRVLVRAGGKVGFYDAAEVVRLTATQVVLARGKWEQRFRRTDYRLVGRHALYDNVRLVEPRERYVREYREQIARDVFSAASHLGGRELLARLGWDRVEELRGLLGRPAEPAAEDAT